MRLLNIPNCNLNNLPCDIGSEVYTKFQNKSYGLRNCDISCRVGDLEERILTSYLLYSDHPIEYYLALVNRHHHNKLDHEILKTNEQLLNLKNHINAKSSRTQ